MIEMEQRAFRNYRQHLGKLYIERNKESKMKPLDFSNILWFNFGKGERMLNGKLTTFNHPDEVWVRYTYDMNEDPSVFLQEKI